MLSEFSRFSNKFVSFFGGILKSDGLKYLSSRPAQGRTLIPKGLYFPVYLTKSTEDSKPKLAQLRTTDFQMIKG